jgi:cell division protein FtsL
MLSITNRIQEIEESILGVDDIVEEVDTTVKENSKRKKLLTHPGNSGHNEKTKSKNNGNRGE